MKLQNKFVFIYFLIFISLLSVMSLSQSATNKIRNRSVNFLFPVWEKILSFKHFLFHPSTPSPFSSLSLEEEKQRLELEKQLLEIELSYLQRQLNEQAFLFSEIKEFSSLSKSDLSPFLTQKDAHKMKCLLTAIPARVIFRSFDTWKNFIWINAGETHNKDNEEPILSLNSPVVIGNSIIGIIDYVGKKESRVRLITDPHLVVSVRASRGGEQETVISGDIERLLQHLSGKKKDFLSPADYHQLVYLLTQFKETLKPSKKTWYLAKGELLGSSSSTSLNRKNFLKGIGFNYDFSDEEGESRDLRTGKSSIDPQKPAVPILKVNDILITTGMDGIFPIGFQVARVTHIDALKEGDYFYQLEAEPIAPSLEELSLVFVLPPQQSKK